MLNKSLIKTNPYLKNPGRRKQLLYTTAVSSTAIEGVHAVVVKELKQLGKSQPIVSAPEASSE